MQNRNLEYGERRRGFNTKHQGTKGYLGSNLILGIREGASSALGLSAVRGKHSLYG